MTAAVNPKAATRESSQTSFIQFAMERTSIKLYQTTTAKVLFDKNKKAIGVTVEAQGSAPFEYNLHASKEVIVSAGAVSYLL
jgi:choline dehydrogenase